MVRNLNNALLRADQISHSEGRDGIDWMLPIVADAEAGFGGTLNAFELMKSMIEAGAAAVCTSRISFLPRRSAATSGAKCWCPLRKRSRN